MTTILITLATLMTFLIFRPSLDLTSEGDLLLWYNKNKQRIYFKICRL